VLIRQKSKKKGGEKSAERTDSQERVLAGRRLHLVRHRNTNVSPPQETKWFDPGEKQTQITNRKGRMKGLTFDAKKTQGFRGGGGDQFF